MIVITMTRGSTAAWVINGHSGASIAAVAGAVVKFHFLVIPLLNAHIIVSGIVLGQPWLAPHLLDRDPHINGPQNFLNQVFAFIAYAAILGKFRPG